MTAPLLEVNVRVRQIKFDSRSILARVAAAEVEPLTEASLLIADTARSMVHGTRRKTFDELTPHQRRRFLIALSESRRHGTNPPRLPWVRSKPGEPPRSPTGRFARSILGAYDPNTRSAVAGSILGGGIPNRLERGGTTEGHRIAPRPLMMPALNRCQSLIAPLFAGMLNR